MRLEPSNPAAGASPLLNFTSVESFINEADFSRAIASSWT